MKFKLTVLCENSVERVDPGGLIGEHGFACHLQTAAGSYLFDTGSGLGLLRNSEQLGIDLSNLQGVILSHGHRDHTGGLQQLLEVTGQLPIYAHPDLFARRFSRTDGGLREIGIPWGKDELARLGGDLRLSSAPQQIAPGVLTSGSVPRLTTDSGDQNLLILADGKEQTDPLEDDLSLFIESEKGLVILLGCAHAGLLNILAHARNVTGQQKIYMIIGGTHLKFSSDSGLAATLAALQDYQVEKIGTAHCTGLRQAQKIAARFGEGVFHASVGTEVVV